MSVKSNQLTNKYVFQMNVNDLLMNFHFENETPINGLKNMPSPNLIRIFIFEIDAYPSIQSSSFLQLECYTLDVCGSKLSDLRSFVGSQPIMMCIHISSMWPT